MLSALIFLIVSIELSRVSFDQLLQLVPILNCYELEKDTNGSCC